MKEAHCAGHIRAPDCLTHKRRRRIHGQGIWIPHASPDFGATSLNQSTGHTISSANTQLPRSTGSHSFHWRNLRPHTGRFKRGPAFKPAGAMSDFARGVVGVLAVGMIAGVGTLLLIPQPSPSAMRFAEPPAKPCSQQT